MIFIIGNRDIISVSRRKQPLLYTFSLSFRLSHIGTSVFSTLHSPYYSYVISQMRSEIRECLRNTHQGHGACSGCASRPFCCLRQVVCLRKENISSLSSTKFDDGYRECACSILEKFKILATLGRNKTLITPKWNSIP